jgi:hypothetical protein
MNTITFATGFIGAVLATELFLKAAENSLHLHYEMDQPLSNSRNAIKVYGTLNSHINNGRTISCFATLVTI